MEPFNLKGASGKVGGASLPLAKHRLVVALRTSYLQLLAIANFLARRIAAIMLDGLAMFFPAMS